MNVPNPGEAPVQVKEAIFRGQKIEAIRLYRECTGAGLAEAKTAVEQLEAELRAAEPDRFAAAASGQGGRGPFGCLLAAVLFAAFGIIFVVAGVRSGLADWAFAARAARTQGTVVRLDNFFPGAGGHSNTSCRPVVSYEVAGQEYQVHGQAQGQPGVHAWPKGYHVGDVVSVLYDPDRPGEAAVESIGPAWVGGPLLFGGLGLTFLLVAVFLLRPWLRRWHGQRESGWTDPVAEADGGRHSVPS